MTQIYISYRPQEPGYAVLYDYLLEHFPNLVLGISKILSTPLGAPLHETIRENILLCDVMLVVIGTDWLQTRSPDGERRITSEGDIVRLEIATALSLKKRVIPVLIGEVLLPHSSDLPADLSELVRKQPVHLYRQTWMQDLDRLIEVINETFASGNPRRADNRTRGVFISYSHKDEKWKNRLVTHLSVLERENLLHIWDDRKIDWGDKWNQEISDAMEAASIAILLISADFLTSKFIRSEEVPRLLARQKQGGLRVVPVIVHPCAWKLVPWLAEIQVRPKDGRTLSKGNKHKIDQDLADLVTEIAIFTSGSS